MRVRALCNHFDGVYRAAGEEFETTAKKLSKHVEKVTEKVKQVAEEEIDGAGNAIGEALFNDR
jgi:hypothetical protein